MARLIALEGPEPGREFPLKPGPSLIGRQFDAVVFLEELAVSRQHAVVIWDGGGYFVEDLGSSNGTFVNGQRVAGRHPLTESDRLQIGPYVLTLRCDEPAMPTPDEPIIRASVAAQPSNSTLYTDNPAYKLQVVMEIAQPLARTPEHALLGKLLDHMLDL